MKVKYVFRASFSCCEHMPICAFKGSIHQPVSTFEWSYYPECPDHWNSPDLNVHSSPLVLSTDIRSVFSWSKYEIVTLASNPDIRSARPYGQFLLEKMWTSQVCSSININFLTINVNITSWWKAYFTVRFAANKLPCLRSTGSFDNKTKGRPMEIEN